MTPPTYTVTGEAIDEAGDEIMLNAAEMQMCSETLQLDSDDLRDVAAGRLMRRYAASEGRTLTNAAVTLKVSLQCLKDVLVRGAEPGPKLAQKITQFTGVQL